MARGDEPINQWFFLKDPVNVSAKLKTEVDIKYCYFISSELPDSTYCDFSKVKNKAMKGLGM